MWIRLDANRRRGCETDGIDGRGLRAAYSAVNPSVCDGESADPEERTAVASVASAGAIGERVRMSMRQGRVLTGDIWTSRAPRPAGAADAQTGDGRLPDHLKAQVP